MWLSCNCFCLERLDKCLFKTDHVFVFIFFQTLPKTVKLPKFLDGKNTHVQSYSHITVRRQTFSQISLEEEYTGDLLIYFEKPNINIIVCGISHLLERSESEYLKTVLPLPHSHTPLMKYILLEV